MTEPGPAAPLWVSFRLTLAEYGSGVRRLSWALGQFKVLVVVTVLAAIGGIVSAVLGNRVLTVALFVVFLAYAAMLSWSLLIRPARQYRRRADLRGEQTYCFSNSEVSMTFMSGDSRVKWAYFADLLETKDLYVLRHSLKQLGSIVP